MFVATVIVSSLLALAAVGSGLAKLSKQPQLVQQLTGLGVPESWLPLLALAELAGAAGLLIGFWLAPLGIAAATGLVLYFAGAVATHVKAGDKNFAAPALLGLLAVAALLLRVASA